MADPAFTRDGAANSKGWCKKRYIIWPFFVLQTAWNWKNLNPREGRTSLETPLDLPMRNGRRLNHNLWCLMVSLVLATSFRTKKSLLVMVCYRETVSFSSKEKPLYFWPVDCHSNSDVQSRVCVSGDVTRAIIGIIQSLYVKLISNMGHESKAEACKWGLLSSWFRLIFSKAVL